MRGGQQPQPLRRAGAPPPGAVGVRASICLALPGFSGSAPGSAEGCEQASQRLLFVELCIQNPGCCTQVCSRSALLTGMLECSTCLRGFHLKCLRPALKAVPEGDWLCPSCERGEPSPRPKKLATSWQRALYGEEVLAVARVEGFARGKDPDGEEE